MIGPFYVTLLLTIICVCVVWLIGSYRLHITILAGVSLLLIFVASPLVLATLMLFLLIYFGLEFIRGCGARLTTLKLASWILFAPLLLPVIVPRELYAVTLLGPANTIDPTVIQLAYLGLSYSAIRFFIAFREELADGARRPWALAGSILFYGSFPAGPIVGMRPFYTENIAMRLRGEDVAIAVARIGWGSAKLLIISRILGDFAIDEFAPAATLGQTVVAWFSMYQAFVVLYLDFSGYTDIAIGLALLYGVRLPENFRAPLLATSMQDFWQRWHRSLGAFISTYLFKPLVRLTGRPVPAIFVAFLFVGLWHEVSWTYLVWGVGHGGGLALNMIFTRRFADAAFRTQPAWSVLGWAATMTWVSMLSMIANSVSLTVAYDEVAALFGAS
jgi:alginate O-acetyltransferase complex protein AlgI